MLGPRTEEEEDDDYVNTHNRHPKHKTCPDMADHAELKDNKKTGKIVISVLALFLILGALSALCAVGILYHNEMLSYEILSEQYANATETLKTLEHRARETERLYEALKVNHQQVQKDLFACNANQNSEQCEKGWKSLGLKCYYFSTFKQSWTQSRDYCVEREGHLVIITSQTEQDFVSSQIGETHWIGLNDLETEGKWMWVNNQPLMETGVMFWYSAPEGPNEPDNWKVQDPSGENCAALGDANGNIHKWFDASCHNMKKCICEK